jgi:methylmalonyl-CoA mutase N-terminal domain/subunit
MEANRLRIQKEKEEKKRLIIGVNAFQNQGEEGPINKSIQDVAYKVPSVQDREKVLAEVKSFKEGRDMEKVKAAIRKLYQDTKAGENVTRAVIDAVKVGVTMSEVVGSIRSGYGIHYDPFEQVEMPDFAREAMRE